MPPPSMHAIPSTVHRSVIASRIPSLPLVTLFVPTLPSPAIAEVRGVNAWGEYRMGDRDTRQDAIRLAIEVANRSALEQVATNLGSGTVAGTGDEGGSRCVV